MSDNYNSTNNGAGIFSTGLDLRGRNVTPLTTPVPTSFSFGAGNDTINLASSSKNNAISAGEGNNAVFTGSGNDTIFAGSGRDVIDAGNGFNTIFAGDGVNLITSGNGGGLINSGSGSDFINVGTGTYSIFAGSGDNVVVAGNGRNTVTAGAGNDRIFTGGGNDVINAGDGNNIINAGTGNNKVTLGSGRDKLILEIGSNANRLSYVEVIGFNVTTDKLRLGESLAGQNLQFVVSGNNTLVKSGVGGRTLLATLVGVTGATQAIVDRGALYQYTATELPSTVADPTKLHSVNAVSINDFGQVAGTLNQGDTYQTAAGMAATPATFIGRRDAFVWEAGAGTTVLTNAGLKVGNSVAGALDGATGVIMQTPNVSKINNLGVIVGTHDEVRTPVGLASDRGLRWTNDGSGYQLSINAAELAGTAGGNSRETYFNDTNDTNKIAGRFINDTNSAFSAITDYANGSAVALPLLSPLNEATARGINNKGTVVGVGNTTGVSGSSVGLVWSKDASGNYTVSTIADTSTLRDVNEAGTIIGTAKSTNSAIVVRNNVVNYLNPVGLGITATANGINELEQVVGSSGGRAFINYNGSATTDLNGLLTTPLPLAGGGAGFSLSSATSINNFGQIVATGSYLDPAVTVANGGSATGATTTRSFVLTASW